MKDLHSFTIDGLLEFISYYMDLEKNKGKNNNSKTYSGSQGLINFMRGM